MFKELNKPPAPNTEATSASTSEKIYVRPLTADDRAAVLSIAEKTGIASPILDEHANRLSKLSYLTLGILTSPPLPKSSSCPPEPTYAPHPEVLLGFCLATLTSNTTLTPEHEEGGETIVLHAVTVTPDTQGKGVGTTLLRSWLDRLRDAAVARRVLCACPLDKVDWLRRFGFVALAPGPQAGTRVCRLEFMVPLSRAPSEMEIPQERWQAGF